jgi:hypothetical protein
MQMRTAGVSIGLAPTSGRLAALRVGCHAGSITLRHRRLGACAVWTAAGGSRFPVNICHPAVTSRPGRQAAQRDRKRADHPGLRPVTDDSFALQSPAERRVLASRWPRRFTAGVNEAGWIRFQDPCADQVSPQQ